ncbi:MAG: ISL3 family transposase [Pseudomonadota bacterium]|nr:MAG: ISL3 family transposase [Pseudomonadota bacterium]QKK02057.1 MAG: ISL3 family transposase [Pseudomonadota bacterium]QKK03099.1 MAG: ISL3 family transposase [Pseudomonadota bacterium]
MHDRELYRQILGVQAPWEVSEVEVDLPGTGVTVHIRHSGSDLACPQCGAACSGYDTRERKWRHLDTCQYKTWLVAQVPRLRCPEHGVHQLPVPWAENNSRLTALFEALVIDWLKIGTISEVAERLGLSWSAVSGVQERAVARGLARRTQDFPDAIGIDETAFQRRHQYVTVISSGDRVLHIADDRKRASLDAWYAAQPAEALAGLRTVAMDMWRPFIDSTLAHVPGAVHKIAFDKFHVAMHLGDAVDKVRRAEHKALLAEGESVLIKSRYLWLQHPDNMTDNNWGRLQALKSANLKTARAWAIKTHAMCLWDYQVRGWARRAWMDWYNWAIRSRLEPVKKVARTIKAHLEGVLTAVVTGATNARAEGFNTMIQKIKRDARGFRNKERFKAAIYFHLGGLDLYPEAVRK